MQERRVQFLVQEDPLEKEMATHSSIPAWEIPGTGKTGGPQSMGSQSWTRLSNWTTKELIYKALSISGVSQSDSLKHMHPCSFSFLFSLYRWFQNVESRECSSLCYMARAQLFSYVQLFVTPWTVARQTPLSTGFSRQEYWRILGCCFVLQGIFATQGSNPGPLHWQSNSLPSELPGKSYIYTNIHMYVCV